MLVEVHPPISNRLILSPLTDGADNFSTIMEDWFEAAKSGNVKKLEEMVKASPEILNKRDDDERTALHTACSYNQEDTFRFLVEQLGVDVNLVDDEGWSTLHCAASAGRAPMVAILLANDAKTNLQTSAGCTALHYASSKGHIKIVKALLESDAKVDVKDKDGLTAACKAILREHSDILRTLIAAGARLLDVEEKRTGDNAMHFAVANQNATLCEVIWTVAPELLTKVNKEGKCPRDFAPADLRATLDTFES